MYISDLVVERRLAPRTVDNPRAMPEILSNITSRGGIRIELKVIAFLHIYI
jgi:hypothetical protein